MYAGAVQDSIMRKRPPLKPFPFIGAKWRRDGRTYRIITVDNVRHMVGWELFPTRCIQYINLVDWQDWAMGAKCIEGGDDQPTDLQQNVREAFREVVRLQGEVAERNAEIVRLRTALNQIAWPLHYNIEPKSLDVALCQKIAQDTLAIGQQNAFKAKAKESVAQTMERS